MDSGGGAFFRFPSHSLCFPLASIVDFFFLLRFLLPALATLFVISHFLALPPTMHTPITQDARGLFSRTTLSDKCIFISHSMRSFFFSQST